MNIPPSLTWLFWCASSLAVTSLFSLTISLTLLLGTVSHRKVALPMVWTSVSVLVASGAVLVVILVNA